MTGENFIASGLDVHEFVRNLLISTMEAEVVNVVWSLSGYVKRARGYKIYNRGKDKAVEREVNKEQLKQELEKILSIVEDSKLDIRIENLNRYVQIC